MVKNNICKLTADKKNGHSYDPDDCDLIVLDLNNEEKNDKYTYLKRNDYKEYSGNSFVWESSSKNDFTFLTLFYDGDQKYIVIFPYVGNLILLRKSNNGSWINLKTNLNLRKLKICINNGNLLSFGYYYFDLQNFNLKFIFLHFCEVVFYEGNLIYNHCDRPLNGYPYSLSFNLLDDTFSIHLMDESILTYQNVKKELPEIKHCALTKNENCYNTSQSTVKRKLEDSKDQKLIKKKKLKHDRRKYMCSYSANFYDPKIDVNAEIVFLDSNMIMSTDKFVAYCSGSYRDYLIRKGFAFGGVDESSEDCGIPFDEEYPSYQITVTRSFYELPENRDLEYKPRSNRDYLGSMKPDITKFKFYGNDDVEIKSDDMEVCYDDLFYVIKFKTELHRVVYDGKEYWNYNNNKNNGFPIKIYFTACNNDMNVCFNDGKIEKVKIKVLYIKMFKIDGFGNRVMITDKEYKVSRPEKDKRLYKLKEGVKCTEIWHDDREFVWKHKEGDPYPISIVYDNHLFSISLRYDSYFIVLLRGLCSMIWNPKIYYIPKYFKLYKLDKIGNKLELNDKDYDSNCTHFGRFTYDLKKKVECVELKFKGETLWKHEQSQPYPHSFGYSAYHETITAFCEGFNIRMVCTKGIWNSYLVGPYIPVC
uniref:SfiI-subtelomeric related protein family member, putative n=1 Tax=Theileria annulata TaxID=5874 RepID=A0A3B0MPE0_THEAN